MALSNGVPLNTQTLRDATLSNTVALPNQGNTANTGWIDLGFQNSVNTSLQTSGPFPVTRYALVNLATTASANSANNKNCNIVLQMAPANSLSNNTADAGNITNIPLRANPFVRVTDASGNSPATATVDFLPPNCVRYIRAQAVAEANSGNFGNDATMTLYISF